MARKGITQPETIPGDIDTPATGYASLAWDAGGDVYLKLSNGSEVHLGGALFPSAVDIEYGENITAGDPLFIDPTNFTAKKIVETSQDAVKIQMQDGTHGYDVCYTGNTGEYVVVYLDNGQIWGRLVQAGVSGTTSTLGAPFLIINIIPPFMNDVHLKVTCLSPTLSVVVVTELGISRDLVAAAFNPTAGTSGGIFTFGANIKINTVGSLDISTIDSTKFLVAWRDANVASGISVSAASVAALAISSGGISTVINTLAPLAVEAMNTSEFILAYRDLTTGFGYSSRGGLTGTAITGYSAPASYTSGVVPPEGKGNSLQISKKTSTDYVISYVTDIGVNDYSLAYRKGVIVAAAPSYPASTNLIIGTNPKGVTFHHSADIPGTPDVGILFMGDSDFGGALKAFYGDEPLTVGLESIAHFIPSQITPSHARISKLDGGRVVICYRSECWLYVNVGEVTVAANTTLEFNSPIDDRKYFYGIAVESGLLGETKKVMPLGQELIGILAGLTKGVQYLVAGGAISNTPGAGDVQIGIAFDTNRIFLVKNTDKDLGLN